MKTMSYSFGMLLLALTSVASAQEIHATVNGLGVHFPDVKPMMVNDRVMVPLRGVFEKMGAKVGLG